MIRNHYLEEPMQIHFRRWWEIMRPMERLRMEIDHHSIPGILYVDMQEMYDIIFYPLGITESLKYLNHGI